MQKEYSGKRAVIADLGAALIRLRSMQVLLLVLIGARYWSWRQLE
jgi:hypothetical protein